MLGSSWHARAWRSARGTRNVLYLGALAIALALLAVAAPGASAAPAWRVWALANSTGAPGGTLNFIAEVHNVGDATADPGIEPITFTATLPAGVTVQSVDTGFSSFDCSAVVPGSQTFTCQGAGTLDPFNTWRLDITTAVDPGVPVGSRLTARFSIAGGGAPAAARTYASSIASAALPPFGIAAFDAQVTADDAGTPFTEAAGHPFAASTFIDFNTYRDPNPIKADLTPVAATKDVNVDLPAGFFGDPSNAGRCTLGQLSNTAGLSPQPLCPVSSQIGTTVVLSNGFTHGPLVFGPLPIYNMEPPPDAPARFGFNASGNIVTFDVSLRSATDYGITAHVRNIPEGLAIAGTSVTLWGVPSDPVHDAERACPGQPGPSSGGPSAARPGDNGEPACPTSIPRTAFLRNPTSCPDPGIGLPTTVSADSWANPGAFVQKTIFSHLDPGYPQPPDQWGPAIGTTGCARVPFRPAISASPDTTVAGAPAGFRFDVTLPQTTDPDVIGQSDLKKAVVTLPLGVHLSPSASSGLEGCSPAQIALHTDTPPSCPAGSKLGTVTITVPALQQPLTGSIYLAQPFDNPFGTLTGIYLVASGSGVTIKLPGRVDLDPFTGQITTTIDDNPQAPFTDVHLEFKGGPRAPLVNPTACDTYTTSAEFTGWSGAVVDTSSSYTVDRGCIGAKFTPGFAAGTESSSAGRSSPLHVRITRNDDDAELGSVTVQMPNGLTGKIAEATLCGEREANAGACPEGSRIGDVTVGAGAGSNPFYITNGRAYITGPYKGAPFGLSMVVPAVAGPFDLGNVVVRSALFVDKHSAAVRIVSDPLPTILQGIPLQVRDVRVAVDKPGFMINPTSCAVTRIQGTIGSTSGASANVSDRFQAAECRALSFAPRMTLAVGGEGHTNAGQVTPLSTRITMPAADANIRYVRVTLPRTLNARLTVINDACTRAEFESAIAKCAHARAGTATAVTPLLRDPLRGNVYFVKNGHPLPDLFIALRGQVAFDLIGRITIVNSTFLRTTFDAAPDVPIRSFALRLFGDTAHGSVGAAANLCAAKSRKAKASVSFIGQNGRRLTVSRALTVRGCPKSKRARHGRR